VYVEVLGRKVSVETIRDHIISSILLEMINGMTFEDI
jgi:hypothetical protein